MKPYGNGWDDGHLDLLINTLVCSPIGWKIVVRELVDISC